jgi:hypothetical protein
MIASREDIRVRVREHLGRVLARLSTLIEPSDSQSGRSESLDGSDEVDRQNEPAARVRHVKRST